jgi:hypothetical protein
VGPFKKMTFASRMQHQIYWGPMKKPVEWSLKTVLAPWAYIASVLYHDSFWYPYNAKGMMREVLDGPWGRLFRNWETVRADADGYPDVGTAVAEIELTGTKALARSLGILGTCIPNYNPAFSGNVRINGNYGNGNVTGGTPAAYLDRNAFAARASTFQDVCSRVGEG